MKKFPTALLLSLLTLSMSSMACLAGGTSPYDPNSPQGLANVLFSIVDGLSDSDDGLVDFSGTFTDVDGNALEGDVEFYLDESVDISESSDLSSDGNAPSSLIAPNAATLIYYTRSSTNTLGYVKTRLKSGLYRAVLRTYRNPRYYGLSVAARNFAVAANSRDRDTRFKSSRPDTTRPRLQPLRSYPIAGMTDYPTSQSSLQIVFSEYINPSSVNTKTVKLSNGHVASITANGKSIRVWPREPLKPSTTYTVTVGANIYDLAGNKLANPGSYSFTTAPVPTVPTEFSISGTIIGIDGTGLVLQINGANDYERDYLGAFKFPNLIADGTAYAVTVKTNPIFPTQSCSVKNGTGTIATKNVIDVTVICSTSTIPTYTVSGTVTGLTGTGLILQNNFGDDLSVTANGGFSFANVLMNRSFYEVSVKTNPTGQVCTVASEAGQINGANISAPTVTCTSASYTVGGSVTGLTGAGLVLQNNGGDNLGVAANGTYTFASSLANAATYNVTIQTQPAGQTCSVTNGTGTIVSSAIDNVMVDCTAYSLGGSVSGLTGAGLVLQNNGGDNLAVAADGSFTFATQLPTNTAYNVTVQTQPAGQTCTVSNSTGTIYASAVNNVVVTCGGVGCLVGGPTVIDAASNGGAEIDTFTLPSGNILIARRGGGPNDLRIYGTDCQRQTTVTPVTVAAYGLNPSFARFGNGTNLVAYKGGSQICSVLTLDDNGGILAGPVDLVTPGTSFNGVAAATLSSGNAMVSCGLRTFVIDSSLATVTGPFGSLAVHPFPNNSMVQLSGGRVVQIYRDFFNSRGFIRVFNADGSGAAGPTSLTSVNFGGHVDLVSLGATAAVVYSESPNHLKLAEVDANGSIVGGPYIIDSTGLPLYISAERAGDGSIYISYSPSGHTNMRYVRVSSAGSILAGPIDFGTSANYRSHLRLVNGHIVFTTGEGVYVVSQ